MFSLVPFLWVRFNYTLQLRVTASSVDLHVPCHLPILPRLAPRSSSTKPSSAIFLQRGAGEVRTLLFVSVCFFIRLQYTRTTHFFFAATKEQGPTCFLQLQRVRVHESDQRVHDCLCSACCPSGLGLAVCVKRRGEWGSHFERPLRPGGVD